MARIGGSRRKRSGIFTKSSRLKGKLSHNTYLQEFKNGEKVTLKLEPAVQKATYLPRFHGKTGTVTKRIGNCYQVVISDGDKQKFITTHPIHLKKTN